MQDDRLGRQTSNAKSNITTIIIKMIMIIIIINTFL